MAENTPPGTTPASDADTAAPTPAPTGGGASPAAAAQPEGGEGGPLLEAVPPIDPASIQVRETPDALSHTIPLDVATLDEIADHLADEFAKPVHGFMDSHPGVRHMVTIAVHAGGAIVHQHDAAADMAMARASVMNVQKLAAYLQERFPRDIVGDVSAIDVAINLLDRAFPRSAAESGLAAARK